MPLIRLVVRAPIPRTRGECIDGPRPCPHITCRFHLATKLLAGSKRLKVRRIPPGQDTCALDVADRGRHTLEAIAARMGLTRERVRQIQEQALLHLRETLEADAGSLAEALEQFFPDREDRRSEEVA